MFEESVVADVPPVTCIQTQASEIRTWLRSVITTTTNVEILMMLHAEGWKCSQSQLSNFIYGRRDFSPEMLAAFGRLQSKVRSRELLFEQGRTTVGRPPRNKSDHHSSRSERPGRFQRSDCSSATNMSRGSRSSSAIIHLQASKLCSQEFELQLLRKEIAALKARIIAMSPASEVQLGPRSLYDINDPSSRRTLYRHCDRGWTRTRMMMLMTTIAFVIHHRVNP